MHAVSEGYAGLRACAEMSWIVASAGLEDVAAHSHLCKYESLVNDLFDDADVPILAMCLYRMDLFPVRVVKKVCVRMCVCMCVCVHVCVCVCVCVSLHGLKKERVSVSECVRLCDLFDDADVPILAMCLYRMDLFPVRVVKKVRVCSVCVCMCVCV